MRRLRRIKILATLGPASSDSAMIRRLFEAGADVFRINMSHTPHDKMRELVTTIRNVESSYGRPIGILVDLQGPKLRLGAFAEGSTQLKNGQSFVLDSDKTPGDNNRVQLPHPEILAALRPGHALLLDDGKVRLIAEETSPERAVTRVVIGGKMSDRKGVSLPDTDLPVSAMTPKDRADLEAALTTEIDWVALSFVQRAEDVNEAKRLIRGRAAVMAKIEKPQAIDRLAEIIEASDALMVARGDRGRRAPDRRDAGIIRHHLLDQLGLDRDPRRARAAEAAGGGDYAEPCDRPQIVRGVGRALRGGGGRARPGRHGRSRRLHCLPRRFCQSRPARDHCRRRAARHRRHHQHGAHRLCRTRGQRREVTAGGHSGAWTQKKRKQPHAK